MKPKPLEGVGQFSPPPVAKLPDAPNASAVDAAPPPPGVATKPGGTDVNFNNTPTININKGPDGAAAAGKAGGGALLGGLAFLGGLYIMNDSDKVDKVRASCEVECASGKQLKSECNGDATCCKKACADANPYETGEAGGVVGSALNTVTGGLYGGLAGSLENTTMGNIIGSTIVFVMFIGLIYAAYMLYKYFATPDRIANFGRQRNELITRLRR